MLDKDLINSLLSLRDKILISSIELEKVLNENLSPKGIMYLLDQEDWTIENCTKAIEMEG